MIVSPKKAAELIKSGGNVAIPTETVYGLAADAFNINAVKETFNLKGRPADNPLIVHISSIKHLEMLAENIPDEVNRLTKNFWPGPLTLILKKKEIVPDIVTAGLQTVAVRMPDHKLTLSLIDETGPLTAPSANRSGKPSPTRAQHILDDYSNKVAVLNGGPCKIGLESTVLDLSGITPAILRPGFITADLIREKTGIFVLQESVSAEQTKKSPGTRYTHYKPKATVVWFDELPIHFRTDTYYLVHSASEITTSENVHFYGKDYISLARDLYDHFRTADYLSYSQIAIKKFPSKRNHPLLFALEDRINKAIG